MWPLMEALNNQQEMVKKHLLLAPGEKGRPSPVVNLAALKSASRTLRENDHNNTATLSLGSERRLALAGRPRAIPRTQILPCLTKSEDAPIATQPPPPGRRSKRVACAAKGTRSQRSYRRLMPVRQVGSWC